MNTRNQRSLLPLLPPGKLLIKTLKTRKDFKNDNKTDLFNWRDLMKLVICGTGPGAQALASKNQENKNFKEIILFELKEGSVDKDTQIHWPNGQVSTLEGCKITSDPSIAIPNADVILLCNPANSYPYILEKIAQHMTPSTKLICGVPGACAFDWMVREAFSGKEKEFTIAATESLPFIAKRSGKNLIKVHALKHQLYLATFPSNASDLIEYVGLEETLGVSLKKLDLFLSLTLINPNVKVHPLLFIEALKFAQDKTDRNVYELGDESFVRLEKIEKEVFFLAEHLSQETGLKIDPIPTLKQWFTDCYGSLIQDNTTAKTCLASHSVYASLKENFLKGTQNGEPNSSDRGKSRYLTEEIPYGLLSLKGLAELANVKTPTIDGVIEDCQKYLSKKYIENGKLIKSNLSDTSAPQRFGMSVLSKLIRQYYPYSSERRTETKEFKNNGIVFFGKLLDENKSAKIQKVITERISNISAVDTEKLLLNLHWTDPKIAEFCSFPEFVSAACDLLQVKEVKIFSSLIVFKKPNEKMPVPWHQDPAYQWPLDPLDCASLWFALDDITNENGAMEMAIGAHKVGILPMRPTPPLHDGEYHFSPQLSHSIAEETLKEFPRIQCDMARYECSFHHSMMPHSSPLNLTQDRRCAFIVRYCRGDAKIKLYPGMPREKFFQGYKLFNPHTNINTQQEIRKRA